MSLIKSYRGKYLKYKTKNIFIKPKLTGGVIFKQDGIEFPIEFVYYDINNEHEYTEHRRTFENKQMREIPYNYVEIEKEFFLIENDNTFTSITESRILTHLRDVGKYNWGDKKIKDVKLTSEYLLNYSNLLKEYLLLPKITKNSLEKVYETKIINVDSTNSIAFAIINGKTIGYIECSSIGRNYIIIEDITISPDYHGKKLCKPFLSFVLQNLKKYNTEIRLYNDSSSQLAACLCYLRAGLETNYQVKNSDGHNITDNDCKNQYVPREMRYIL